MKKASRAVPEPKPKPNGNRRPFAERVGRRAREAPRASRTTVSPCPGRREPAWLAMKTDVKEKVDLPGTRD